MNVGTFAYGASAGASVCIGMLFLLMGLRRAGPRRIELAVALAAVAAALSSAAHVLLQSSDDVEEYASVLRGPFAVSGVLVLIALAWVVGLTTEAGMPNVPLALTGGAFIVAAVNFMSDGGVIVDEVTALRPVTLFGEEFVLHQANRSSSRLVLDVYLVLFVAYVVFAIVRGRRRGLTGYDAFAGGVAALLVANVYDSLVDEAVTSTAYLAPFGLLAFVVGITAQQASQVGEVRRQLLARSEHLEALVAGRTESLREANRRIVDELDRQTAAARHVARLTQTLVDLNDVGDGMDGGLDVDLEPHLAASIESIGALAGATDVELELYDPEHLDLGQLHVRWTTDDDAASAPTDARTDLDWPLHVGGVPVGHLVVRRPAGHDLSIEQEELIDLSAHFLAVVVHRLSLVARLVVSAVDDERRRIARDLHDSVSQRLYAAAFRAEAVAKTVERDPALAADNVMDIRSLVLTSLAEMRTLLFELQPEILAKSKLTGLVATLCESMCDIHDREIQVIAVDGPPVPPEPKLALYRVAQEALGNALRHSGASQIAVSVVVDEAGANVEVTDDGEGFVPDAAHTGHGLWNIGQRAGQVGALVDIASELGGGTTVSARWTRDRDQAPVVDLVDRAESELARP